MKRCSRCGQEKELAEFTKHSGRSDGLQPFCNTCQRAAVREHYYERRDYYLAKASRQNQRVRRQFRDMIHARKRVPCSRCGERFHPAAMHFDHVRGEKLFNVGQGDRRTRADLEAEILKCLVRCANCHMDLTLRPRVVEAGGWLAAWPEVVYWKSP